MSNLYIVFNGLLCVVEPYQILISKQLMLIGNLMRKDYAFIREAL